MKNFNVVIAKNSFSVQCSVKSENSFCLFYNSYETKNISIYCEVSTDGTFKVVSINRNLPKETIKRIETCIYNTVSIQFKEETKTDDLIFENDYITCYQFDLMFLNEKEQVYTFEVGIYNKDKQVIEFDLIKEFYDCFEDDLNNKNIFFNDIDGLHFLSEETNYYYSIEY